MKWASHPPLELERRGLEHISALQSSPEINHRYRELVDEGHGTTCMTCTAKKHSTKPFLDHYCMPHMVEHLKEAIPDIALVSYHYM